MKKTLVIGAVLIICAFTLFGFGAIGYGVSLFNTANTLKNTYEAKISANQADFDNLKKVIQQTANISEVQMEKLKEIYVQYADARTSDAAGAILNFVTEAVPNIDTTTFTNLQNIIVANRTSWTNRQKELVDISREYNLLLVRFPSNIVLGIFGFQKINPLVITSEATEEAFRTKQDNDTKLFN